MAVLRHCLAGWLPSPESIFPDSESDGGCPACPRLLQQSRELWHSPGELQGSRSSSELWELHRVTEVA